MNMKKIIAFASAIVMMSGIYVGIPVDTENVSPFAITVEATTKTEAKKAEVPANFKTKKTNNSITLSWDKADGADMYRVYKYNDKTGKYEKYKDVKSAKCTVSGLKAGTKYKFKVVSYAKNANGKYVKGKSSKTVSVTTKPVEAETANNIVGNDTAGYIKAYYDYKYTEANDGSFSITSKDGKDRTDVLFYDNIQTDLDQTAYMLCLTALMNAEDDGFEVSNMNNVEIDGMNGYFAVVIDNDEGTGFKLYLTLVDNEKGIIRVLRHESTKFTQDNLLAASAAFDSYRLKKS